MEQTLEQLQHDRDAAYQRYTTEVQNWEQQKESVVNPLRAEWLVIAEKYDRAKLRAEILAEMAEKQQTKQTA